LACRIDPTELQRINTVNTARNHGAILFG